MKHRPRAASVAEPTISPDSLLEESGFELLVPPGKGTASFEAKLINRRHLLLPENQASGTEGSNPLSSSGESAANLTSLTKSGPPLSDYFRGFELLSLSEEDHPGTTKLGEPKHWHIFHIIARLSR